MDPTRIALFIVEFDESREWIEPLAREIGFQPVIRRRPTLHQVMSAAPDLIILDCRTTVPTQWVQILQELRESPLFETTPVLVACESPHMPAAMAEIPKVAWLTKPLELGAVFEQLTRLGINVERRASPTFRRKSEKFQILDSPRLLDTDLKKGAGHLGCAVLYLDIDHFKELNTRHLEREVDRRVLGPFQRLLSNIVESNGRAYAEGGDEIIIWLPNVTLELAMLFAETVRHEAERAVFPMQTGIARITVSIGVAFGARGSSPLDLPDQANAAKRHAKETGRNRVVLFSETLMHAVLTVQEQPRPRASPPQLRKERLDLLETS